MDLKNRILCTSTHHNNNSSQLWTPDKNSSWSWSPTNKLSGLVPTSGDLIPCSNRLWMNSMVIWVLLYSTAITTPITGPHRYSTGKRCAILTIISLHSNWSSHQKSQLTHSLDLIWNLNSSVIHPKQFNNANWSIGSWPVFHRLRVSWKPWKIGTSLTWRMILIRSFFYLTKEPCHPLSARWPIIEMANWGLLTF